MPNLSGPEFLAECWPIWCPPLHFPAVLYFCCAFRGNCQAGVSHHASQGDCPCHRESIAKLLPPSPSPLPSCKAPVLTSLRRKVQPPRSRRSLLISSAP